VQRGRLILDVSAADLEAAETTFGAFHSTTWHFRNALNEAQRSWDRLRAELGTKGLEAALAQPPLTTLTLGESANGIPCVVLILITGQTYRSQRVGAELAAVQWRLIRLNPPLEHGPTVCRLADGSTQCDCARLDLPDRRDRQRSQDSLQAPGRRFPGGFDQTNSRVRQSTA
jgi:hypothetical protein